MARDSNFYPRFFGHVRLEYGTVDIVRHCHTLTDYRKSRWRPPKPEMEIAIERTEPATRFQLVGLPPTFAIKPDMAEETGVEVGIAAPSLAVQKLFPLPVSLAAILNAGITSMFTPSSVIFLLWHVGMIAYN